MTLSATDVATSPRPIPSLGDPPPPPSPPLAADVRVQWLYYLSLCPPRPTQLAPGQLCAAAQPCALPLDAGGGRQSTRLDSRRYGQLPAPRIRQLLSVGRPVLSNATVALSE